MRPFGVGLLMLAAVSDAGGGAAKAQKDIFQNFLWKNRLLLVFAPGAGDARLQQQLKSLRSVAADLAERDLRVIRLLPDTPITIDGVATEFPEANKIYRDFDIKHGQFAVVLVGKDGSVKMRSNEPSSLQAVFELVDSMPMRQLEIEERRGAAN